MKTLKLDRNAGILNALTVSRLSPKIVGGKPAPPNKYPWMAALFFRGCSPSVCQFCGGALVRKNWVLTAAHCAAAVGENTPIDVFLGATNLGGQGEAIRVAELIVHEGFDPDILDNDLALLRLESDSSKTTIEIIEPRSRGPYLAGNDSDGHRIGSNKRRRRLEPGFVGGRGSHRFAGDRQRCIPATGKHDHENMLAAGLPEGGKDTCQGDSGGPFLVLSPEKSFILAVATSWGIGCARPGLPGIYTRLSRYGDWLSEHLV